MFARHIAVVCLLAPVAAPTLAQTEPRAVVQGQIAAYQARDIDRFVATFAPDAVVEFDRIRAVGPSQIRALYSLNFAPAAPKVEVRGMVVEGARVRVEAAYRFANGNVLCCSVSQFTVGGDKVTRLVVTMP